MSKLFDISMAILNCAEYNKEKLEAYGWPLPKSPEEAVRRELEMGICKIILVLDSSKKCFWSEANSRYTHRKLRQELAKLINNTVKERAAKEHLAELRQGIGDGLSYLDDAKTFMNSKALQHIENYLNELQRMLAIKH